jgi:hypothetical protein
MTTNIRRASTAIAAAFSARDSLYSAGDFTSPEVKRHERAAADAQLELADLVKSTDAGRAKRLREMANSYLSNNA